MSLAKALRLDPGLHTLRFLSSLSAEEILSKINEPDELGDTPLHVAAAKQLKLAVSFLIQYGANLNATNNAGSTPLHKAAASGGRDVFKYLLDKCEWVQNHSGLTPFDLASEIFRSDIDIFKKLLAKEPNVTESLTIPADSLAFVCGKANLNLARIRAEAFTLVDFEKFDKKDGEKERTIHLTARNKEDLEEAKRMIAGTLKFKEEIDAKEREKQKNAPPKKQNQGTKDTSDVQKETKAPSKSTEPADFKTFSRTIGFKTDFEKLLPALNAPAAQSEDAKQSNPPGASKVQKLPPGAAKQPNSNKTVVPPKFERKTVVKDIEERNNVKIVLPAKNKEEPIVVSGEPNNVQNAIKEINALRPEKESKSTERKLYVTKQNHKYVIGKKGSNIDRIRKEIGVSVIVPNADSPDEDIILRGAPADIEVAKVDIINLLKSLTSGGPRPDFASRGQGRGPFSDDGGRGGRGRGGPRGGRNRPAFDGEGEKVYRRVDGGDNTMTLGDWAPQNTQQARNDTAPSPQEPTESAQNNNQNQQRFNQRQNRSNNNQNQQRNNNQTRQQNNKSKLNLTDPNAFPSL